MLFGWSPTSNSNVLYFCFLLFLCTWWTWIWKDVVIPMPCSRELVKWNHECLICHCSSCRLAWGVNQIWMSILEIGQTITVLSTSPKMSLLWLLLLGIFGKGDAGSCCHQWLIITASLLLQSIAPKYHVSLRIWCIDLIRGLCLGYPEAQLEGEYWKNISVYFVICRLVLECRLKFQM